MEGRRSEPADSWLRRESMLLIIGPVVLQWGLCCAGQSRHDAREAIRVCDE